MLLRDLTIANICVQPDCQTSLRPRRRSSKGKTGQPAASKAVLSAPRRGFVHAIRWMPSEIRKIEKNRFRKATATGSAIFCAGTYCLALKSYCYRPDYQKSRNGASAALNFISAAPVDLHHPTTALVSRATSVHLDGILTGVPPHAKCDPSTSSGSTPALGRPALQQIDHTRAHHRRASIPVSNIAVFRRIMRKRLKTQSRLTIYYSAFPLPADPPPAL